jgi:prevent-host-death family protein
MELTYNIREAQANLPKLCRSERKFVISNRGKPVVVAVPVGDYEALMETIDLLGDSAAVRALRSAKSGSAKYRALDLSDENFGL